MYIAYEFTLLNCRITKTCLFHDCDWWGVLHGRACDKQIWDTFQPSCL